MAGEESYLFDVLENRLESNMAREDLESLLELLGLGITGEAPVKRPCILWVSGPSGSGKGMVGNLVLEAFGSVAHAVKAETLQRRSNDIDSEIASVLEANPRLIVCDEMGGKVSEKKWMGLTGNTPWTARRPHGKEIKRVVRALWICPTIEAPHMSRNGGMADRSAALHLPKVYRGPRDSDFDARLPACR